MSERFREIDQAMSPAELDADVPSEHVVSEYVTSNYEQRLTALRRLQTAERRREMTVARLKLVDGALIVVLAFLYVGHPGLGASLALGAAVIAFVVLLVVHERILRSIALRERAERFYERGLARLHGTWMEVQEKTNKGRGGKAAVDETGAQFLPDDHAYARDLDLFGKGSLFHLLSTARTMQGQETLAGWLLAPAPIAVARARQAAVQELTADVDLREALATVGEDVRAGVHGGSLAAWGESALVWRGNGMRVATGVLAALWVASLGAWAVWGNGLPVLIASLVNYGVRYRVRAQVEASLEGLDEAARELTVLAGLLRLVEAREFTSPRLHGLRAALERDGMAPSAAIARLERVLHRLDSRHNMMLRALDLFAFWTVQLSFVAEGWKRRFGPAVHGWLEAAGEFEALESLAGYAYEHPADVWPEFVEDGAYLCAEEFAHPLLPEARAVRNSLELGGSGLGADQDLRLVVISGPNMAGKSTFLRGLGVNVVLAQMGAPVRARRLRLSPLMVGASIAVMDSLESGISRFYAEIRRVKLISDLADGALPVLFLLDEVLSGTNSHDRLVGTEWMVGSFVERGAIGIVTTHDLALTAIPETMDGRGVNCHFSDTIVDGRLHFDYRLSPGVVETSNALELMRSIGLRVDG
jgi:membrane protein implicated in regulation of membrane protease activity